MTGTMDKIVSLCKRRGFVYPTSEIYGGLANSYDYGPLGAELLKNIRDLWWREFIHKRDDMVGLDSQILLHPQTWVASGHASSFADPMVEDKKTHKRYRVDHLIEQWIKSNKGDVEFSKVVVEDMKMEDMGEFIKKWKINSPDGNELTEPKQFNLLFETKLGVVEGEKALLYLRGETAQGIFSNFKSILDSTRVKLPFGVGQIGKSFRNEITTGQFVFRTLELEQAEIEYFFDPSANRWEDLLSSWKEAMWQFVTKTLGITEEHLSWRRHTDKERSHYSMDTYDLDYAFPFGKKELWGVAYRSDYDLKQHMRYSGASLEYLDQATGRKFVPHVIEPALGINRTFLMILTEAFREDEKRTYLSFSPALAPKTVAVFPLIANKPDLTLKAQQIYQNIKALNIKTAWDDRGNIGKRYLYQDEMGTPWCVTVDYATLDDDTVTVRDRDSMKQERVNASQLENYFKNKLK